MGKFSSILLPSMLGVMGMCTGSVQSIFNALAWASASVRYLRSSKLAKNSSRSSAYCSRTSSMNSWRCLASLLTMACTTGTLRLASSTWITGPEYTGEILTAVCILLVVAPPMSSGVVMPRSCIFFATVTISSKLGVMSPDSPMTSALCSTAASRILSQGVITPRSITLKLLQPSTTDTMFLPMSCTSPLTVAMTNTPALLLSPDVPLRRFSSSMKGMRCATDFFITRADLIT
mmetsp:Transcript_15025/g.26111  ORF Transcript_15025/g.26111 Transcript_15025/m.26111 type:complete len:233 (+) Transcript_15025:1816-2514(+)